MSAPGNKPQHDPTNLLLYAAAYLFVVFILMRFLPQLAMLLLVIGVLILLSFTGMLVYRGTINKLLQRETGEDYAFKQRVASRLQDCKQKEERFRNEAEAIRHSIRQLKDDLEQSPGADDQEKERVATLEKELQAEFNLRLAKARFFADCSAKLQQLLDRHRLQESIAARKKELENLRQTNFDDEAALEETRYHLEQDTIELDTIAELSRDVAVSFKAEQAEELRVRLEQLRAKL